MVKHFIQGQSVSCALKANVMYLVKGKLGLKVWTVTDLANPCKEMIIDALSTSYELVSPKRLTDKSNN